MLRWIARIVIVTCCLAVMVEAAVLWRATGAEGYTKYPKPAEEESAESGSEDGGLSDLFSDTGLEDAHGELEELPNKFALGLAPSGPDKHVVSLLTLAGPAGLAALLTLVMPALGKRGKKNGASEE